MSASFDRERAEWKAKAARSLQSSRLTRSLGRSRSQSTGRTRAQLKETGGMGFLATKTLLGNQLAAPTVHTPTSSDGTQTQPTRSSHARTLSSGHSRAGSKGKAALRAATGLCISDDKMSPKDESFICHDGDAKVVRIEASPPRLDIDLSPSPPMTSDSAIGIAMSTPPLTVEPDAAESPRPVYVPVHPYAQSMPWRSYTRPSSDYAGPHPSAVSVTPHATALASDMSARHRLPPQSVSHPYASALANATSSQHSAEVPLVHSKGSHEAPTEYVPPPPKSTQQSMGPRRHPPPLSDAREVRRAAPHAYASGSRFSSTPLILADAFSFGLERRFSADSGLGDSESHHEAPSSSAHLFSSLPGLALATTPERSRPDFAHGRAFLSLRSNHTSPAETFNPPVFTASMLDYSLTSAQASLADEVLPGSRASSPQQSPRPLSRIEDLDRYRNLFYQPMASGSNQTLSDEHHRAGLTRQLGSEFDTMQDLRHLDGVGSLRDGPPHMWGLKYGGSRGGDGTGSRTDPNAVLSITSGSEMGSPGPMTLPLSLHRSLGRPSDASLTIHIPQDVESRRSSVLDRSEIEDADHDGTYGLPLTASNF
jgi:serine/arginine repetitive matrix protein 2